jgi:hypothetical protein
MVAALELTGLQENLADDLQRQVFVDQHNSSMLEMLHMVSQSLQIRNV